MSVRLILKDTRLVDLTKYPGEDGPTQVLAVRSLLTRPLADQLKIHDLCFAENGMPRRFDSVKVKEVIEDCEVSMDGMTLLANRVSTGGVGRPKTAAENDISLEISLSMHFAGTAPLSDWFDQKNKAEFEISVRPPDNWNAQQSLFEKSDPDNQPEKEEVNCVDCANNIPFQDGSTTVHDSGEPCARATAQAVEPTNVTVMPALSTAREAAGGTHQRGRKPKSASVDSDIQVGVGVIN